MADNKIKKTNQNKFKGKSPDKDKNNNYQNWIIIAGLISVVAAVYLFKQPELRSINFNELRRQLVQEEVKKIAVINDQYVEITLTAKALKKTKYKNLEKPLLPHGPHFVIRTPSEYFMNKLKTIEEDLPESKHITPNFEERKGFGNWFFSWGFFIVLILGFWWFMRRLTSGGAGGGQIFNIGKSKAVMFDGKKVETTFKDIAGLDEAKEEVEEVVQFLKNPDRYTDLGGKIPKGVLLIGPPGTGKTLLAKAVAGESNVPFFSLSGSDFLEMFVGVGAARVRDLFKQAKEKAPCIVFIDEVDAIGRSRGGRSQLPSGANDERENTLNSLLVEMDGFGTQSGIIVLAATNRPDVLDGALTRAGRFDRQISIDKPDLKAREAIFEVHMKPIKVAESVLAEHLASQTPGFAGADIANVCNEAALIAGRKDKKQVDTKDFEDAIDRVIGGLERKNKIITPHEKRIVAYHEAGHAVASWFLRFTDPLVKVSIVPRGLAALGYAQYLPKERFLKTKEEMIDDMTMALGGRAAEEIIFGKVSTGALSDLERITKTAYSMVTIYGMNDALGNISYYDPERGQYNFDKPYSQATAKIIDEEVKKLVDGIYQRTKKLLTEKRQEVETIAQELLKKEVIFRRDIEKMIGLRPFKEDSEGEMIEVQVS